MTTSTMAPDAGSERPGLASLLLALTPVWLLLLLSALTPEFVRALGAGQPGTAGVALPLVVELAALAWMLIGVAVIRNAASRLVESLALTVFTIPATVVVVVLPAATFIRS